MSPATQPSLFVSHGSPMTMLLESPARDFLKTLASALPERPRAILSVSAHWDTSVPMLSAMERNDTIYDFYGFPDALYKLRYDAPGAPALAAEIAAALQGAGFSAGLDTARGLDHGSWVPLLLAFPQTDIPVLQLSVQSRLGPAHHLAVGKALAAFRVRGVLVLGSGSFTHDLRRFRGGAMQMDAPETTDVTAFSNWMDEHILGHDTQALLNYRKLAPYAADQHPTEEHLLPLFTALGAAGENARATRLHSSTELGFIRMDTYEFQ